MLTESKKAIKAEKINTPEYPFVSFLRQIYKGYNPIPEKIAKMGKIGSSRQNWAAPKIPPRLPLKIL